MRKLTYQEIFSLRPGMAELEKTERMPIYCLAENIRSLYNVGSIFRTSDAVLLKKLYLCGYSGYPPRREIEKTALGATETVPWEYSKKSIEIANRLKNEKIQLIALEHTTASVNFSDVDFKFPFCLMLGNEVEGLSDELVSLSDAQIEIPMLGVKHSLNVSVAYGIVIYHVLNQWLNKNS